MTIRDFYDGVISEQIIKLYDLNDDAKPFFTGSLVEMSPLYYPVKISSIDIDFEEKVVNIGVYL